MCISIPMWKAASTIRRAVDSVLAQTFIDFELYVVNDGDPNPDVWAPLEDIDDPRLTTITTATNNGRYSIDHWMTSIARSLGCTWWAPVDADDWVEPGWLDSLIAVSADADVVFAPQFVHPLRQPTTSKVETVRRWDGTGRFEWHAHLSGLWRLDWLADHPVTNPHARVGWDTVMTSIPWATGRVAVAERPGYHRVRRTGSLTTDPVTGPGSRLRREAVSNFSEVWRRIAASPDHLADIMSDVLDPPPVRHSASDLVHKPGWGEWAIDSLFAAELDRRLHVLAPRTIVEIGSGMSTQILARYARASGATVLSLDHDERYARRTAVNLGRYATEVKIHWSNLVGSPPWYSRAVLPDGIDFVLIDGPPLGKGGRRRVLDELWSHLSPDGWEMWLDDADRPHERQILEEWQHEYPIHVELPTFADWMARITPEEPVERHPVDATGVVVTILSGMRPSLLDDTLTHLPDGLLASATVIALANGADEPTRAVYEAHRIEPLTTPTMLSLGDATSLLAEHALASGCEHWLHLEDDWRCVTLDDHWLDDARRTLNAEPDVAQVRLRHHSETTLTRHRVTRANLRWQPHRVGRVAAAHLTVNPSLVRTEQFASLFPIVGETDLQQRGHTAGLTTVVQHHPGVFIHTGDDLSLRAITGCPT